MGGKSSPCFFTKQKMFGGIFSVYTFFCRWVLPNHSTFLQKFWKGWLRLITIDAVVLICVNAVENFLILFLFFYFQNTKRKQAPQAKVPLECIYCRKNGILTKIIVKQNYLIQFLLLEKNFILGFMDLLFLKKNYPKKSSLHLEIF